MVIHPDKVRVRIKSDQRWSRLKHQFTLENQAGGVPDGGTQETSEKRLNATANLKGGKSSQEEVRSQRLIFGFVLQFSDRFLVSLDSFMLNDARFSLDVPQSHLVDHCHQVLGGVGKVAQHVDDHRKELDKKASHNLLSRV